MLLIVYKYFEKRFFLSELLTSKYEGKMSFSDEWQKLSFDHILVEKSLKEAGSYCRVIIRKVYVSLALFERVTTSL